MDSNHHQLSGPDFLDQLADIASGMSEDINAAEFRNRSIQWKADQVELEFARQRCAELEAQLANVSAAFTAARTHLVSSVM